MPPLPKLMEPINYGSKASTSLKDSRIARDIDKQLPPELSDMLNGFRHIARQSLQPQANASQRLDYSPQIYQVDHKLTMLHSQDGSPLPETPRCALNHVIRLSATVPLPCFARCL